MWFVLSASKLDFRFLSVIRSVLAMLSALGMIAVALIFKNAAALIAYSAILGLAQFLILLQRGNSKYNLPVRFADFRKSRLVEMLPYALKTFAQLISGCILGSADRVMLGRLAPAADFSAYNVALNIGGRVQNLSQAAMGPIFCNTTRGVGGDASRGPEGIYRDSLQMLFPWYGLVVVWIAVWHEPLISFWLSENAPLVIKAFPWIVAGCCLTALSNISGAQLGPLNRVGTGLAFSLVSCGLSVLLVVGGWHFAGLAGAAAGFCAARFPMLIQDAFVRRLTGFGYDSRDLRLILMQGVFFAFCATVRLLTEKVGASAPVLIGLAFVTGTICACIILSSYLPKYKS
jgi:O-antigen/teichoic acid export membrane protein